MTTVEMLLLVVLAVTVVLATISLTRTVRADGLGHRPPPRSHAAWDAECTEIGAPRTTGRGDPSRR